MKKIWVEGEFVDWEDAKIHLLTHTMHYGMGAFEGIRAYKRADGRPRSSASTSTSSASTTPASW